METRLGDKVVFWFCLAIFVWFIGYSMGTSDAKALPKVCAKATGETVISSTADTCTYARAWGVAVWKRKAL